MIFFCLFSSSPVVIVALLGLRGGHGEVGRVGRHGELFLDAGDGRGACDSAGCCFVYLESPLSSSRIKLNGFKIRKVLQTPQNVTNKVVGTKCQTYLHLYLGIRPSFPSLSLSSVSFSSSRYERCRTNDDLVRIEALHCSFTRSAIGRGSIQMTLLWPQSG